MVGVKVDSSLWNRNRISENNNAYHIYHYLHTSKTFVLSGVIIVVVDCCVYDCLLEIEGLSKYLLFNNFLLDDSRT